MSEAITEPLSPKWQFDPDGTVQPVLWDLSVAFRDFRKKVAAAAAGGFAILTIPTRVYLKELAQGRSAQEMLRIAGDAGISLNFLDGLTGWAPLRYPSDIDPWIKDAFDVSSEHGLDICEELGMDSIVAVGAFDRGILGVPELINAFGGFCERAAKRGIWVDLEFMRSMPGVDSLEMARCIVEGCGAHNCGIMLDTWHLMRGGGTLDQLASMSPGRIVNIQIVDGPTSPSAPRAIDDALNARLLPGEGDLHVADIVAVASAVGPLRTIGPEVSTTQIHGCSDVEVGRICAEATKAVAKKAGVEIGFSR